MEDDLRRGVTRRGVWLIPTELVFGFQKRCPVMFAGGSNQSYWANTGGSSLPGRSPSGNWLW